MICKLKASSLPVVVPSSEGDEAKIPVFDEYWLKIKLLRDLSELPVEHFVQNQSVFESAMKMIEYHLFYRTQEYRRLLHEIMEKNPLNEDAHEQEIIERAWYPILKPVHLILNKIIRSKSKLYQVEASFIAELVQLISSPVEEETKMMSDMIMLVLFNSNSVTSRIVISAINDLFDRSLLGEIPFLSIEPILRLVGDLMWPCSQRKNSFVTTKILEIVKTKVLPLHSHVNLFWIHEAYTHAILQYFIFFEVAEGMSIIRSPFEPCFPDVSPFNNSKEVNTIRRALIRRTTGDNIKINRLNQLAKFDSLFKLMMYQFYPRAMLVDIFEAIKIDFVEHLSIETAILFYALITKMELLRVEDEASFYIKGALTALNDVIKKCHHHGHELGRICVLISQQIELMNAPKVLESDNIKVKKGILIS